MKIEIPKDKEVYDTKLMLEISGIAIKSTQFPETRTLEDGSFEFVQGYIEVEDEQDADLVRSIIANHNAKRPTLAESIIAEIESKSELRERLAKELVKDERLKPSKQETRT